MMPAQLVPALMQASLALVVISLGLRTAPGDLTYLLRRPGLLLRSVLAMNVVTPLIAAALAAWLKLKPEVEVALVLLAVSPVPPVLPGKQVKAGGNESYAIGLLAISAVLSIAVVPASVALIGRAFGFDAHVPAAVIARVVVVSVLGPLFTGVLVRMLAPEFAAKVAKALSAVGSAVLVILLVIGLGASWRSLVGSAGEFTVIVVVAFVLLSLAAGHLLGGPDEHDRTVLALSTASRHPGVALAIAAAVAEDKSAVSSAILLAFVVGMLATGPYTRARRGPRAAGEPPAAGRST